MGSRVRRRPSSLPSAKSCPPTATPRLWRGRRCASPSMARQSSCADAARCAAVPGCAGAIGPGVGDPAVVQAFCKWPGYDTSSRGGLRFAKRHLRLSAMRPAIFWLHIKKSGGMSTRAALAPLYKEVDRSSVPSCLAGRPQNEWNDILNNYRVPLGTYQFRRSDFAKDILYPEDWPDMIRLAFCREPVDRVLSMYFYLFSRRERRREEMRRALAKLPSPPRRLLWSESYAFSVFLDLLALQNALRRQSIY